MFHSFIGQAGHFCVIVAFVSSLLSSVSFSLGAFGSNASISWLNYSRAAFVLHFLSVMGVVIALFLIIYNHYYEYYYAWSHSSNHLPVQYMVSCFWEGQEGSFLLWLFWHCIIGAVLLLQNKKWQMPVMAVVMAVQTILASMILGIAFGEVKIGSSPFILMREFMADAPIFQRQPDFVPTDGTGLNPLLQNYWMVIHPPTLFLGFALTVVPFAYCIAGLAIGKYTEWMQACKTWTIIGCLVLGVGILMGGYWAYETLNFGGYWNWDPVENAVYVPWLVMVASIHGMILSKKGNRGTKTTVILTLSTFILILYSTFLTRSGILGNASVHSFTDLGLSGQLLIYLLAFVLLSIAVLIWRWKQMPASQSNISIWSSDFWILLGIVTLSLAAFQVITSTSIPVYNAVFKAMGLKSNMALPADQVTHYSKFQLWFGVAIAILSGTAQYFYWKKITHANIQSIFYYPLIFTLAISIVAIYFFEVNHFSHILLLISSIYSMVSSTILLVNVVRTNPRLSGGLLAHIGIAFMLVGILFSAGYSKIVSVNTSGLLYSKEFSNDMNRDNVLLWRGQVSRMGPYSVCYKGPRVQPEGYNVFIDKKYIMPTQDPYLFTITKDIVDHGKILFKAGDTIEYQYENTFFEIEFTKNHQKFTLYPRAQVNKEMGLLASPDIKKSGTMDLYAHVSSIPDENQEREWSEAITKTISVGDTFLVNDFFAVFESVQKMNEVEGVPLSPTDAAIKAKITVLGNVENAVLEPIFIIHNQMVGRIPDFDAGLGIRIVLLSIEPQQGKFTFSINTTQRDWVILKAMEKPWIDLLWGGAILVMLGFLLTATKKNNGHQ